MKHLRIVLLVLGVAAGASTAWTQSPAPGSRGGLLLVANKTDRSLSLIDPVANKQVATVPEDAATGHEVAASPDGTRAYVPIYGDSGVGRAGSDGRHMMVIDLASRKPVGQVDFGKGLRPHHPVIGPKNGLLYVTTELDQSVTIIDPKTLTIVGTVPTGQPESHMLVITKDGKRGFTSNVGSGTVSVLDLDAKKTITVIKVSPRAQRIALTADEKFAITADQTQPRLAFINASTHTIDHWIALPAIGFSTAPTADGKWLLVTMPSVNKLAVVDLQKREVAKTIDLPQAPQEVIIRPDGAVAYVSSDIAAKVAAIRIPDWTVATLIDAGKGADGLAWASAGR